MNKAIFSTCTLTCSEWHVLNTTLLIWPSTELEEFVNRLLSVCAGNSVPHARAGFRARIPDGKKPVNKFF